MSMFEELYQLALGATLTLTISADERSGKLTVNVIPKPKADHGEAALSTPLSLTAAPAEFDESFVSVLSGYRSEHRSLAEQAEATKDLLSAAKSASQNKARGAVAKASAKPAPKAAGSRDDEPDAGDEGGGSEGEEQTNETGAETSAANTTPQAQAASEPLLFG
jgi:PRTRC genetic system protein E